MSNPDMVTRLGVVAERPDQRWLVDLFKRTVGVTFQRGSIALIDQALVSGVNFLIGVLIGRAIGAVGLGTYALGFTIVTFSALVQDALIGVPYTVFSNRLQGVPRATYAGAALAHACSLTAMITSVLLAGVGVLAAVGIGSSGLHGALAALALTIPFLQLREFARRVSFAHLRMATVLKIDLVATVLQVGGVVALMRTGRLSAATAFVAMGIGAALAGLGWLLGAHSSFRFERSAVVKELRRHWSFGKWDLGAQLTNWLNQAGLYWLLALLLDTKSTGVFAAAMAVVALANPFVLGVSNLAGPMAARVFAAQGREELSRVVRKVTVLLGVAMAGFCVLVTLGGGAALTLLYGSEFAGYGALAATLALAQWMWSAGVAVAHGLRTLERPDIPFRASALSLGVTFALAMALIAPLGLIGVAGALLLGRIAELALRGAGFHRVVAHVG